MTSGNATIPWWIAATTLLGALLMSLGAVIALLHPAMLVSPGDTIGGAARVYAGYLVSRNLAVATFLLLALALRARAMLNYALLLTAWIQILDAVVDAWEGRWVIVPGVAVLGMLLLVASARLCGHPFWSLKTWKESR